MNWKELKTWERAYLILVAFCLLNFAAFLLGTYLLGGDAVNGAVVNGHYFLAEKHRRTEVSRAVFTYSTLHVWSLWLTWPSMMVIGAIRNWRRRKHEHLVGLPRSW